MKITTIVFSLFITFSINAMAQDAMENAYDKSYSLEKSGNYVAAINIIKAIYSPADYEGNLRLGYLNYEAGQYAEAMNYYSRAIVLKPNAVEPRLGYVYPASMLGRWDDVVKQYLEILKLDPKNSAVNYKMGLINYNRKNYINAAKFFGAVISLYPFDYDGMLMMAWTNLQLGKTKEARAGFNKVLLLSPRDKSALEGLSLIK